MNIGFLQNLDILRPIVWTDYRLAVLFTVVVPLALLIWAFLQKEEAMQTLLVIYWRVASLLAITVYLMIGGLKISFITALMSHVLIVTALWFWVDLNDEIREHSPGPLKLVLTSWRWAMTFYSSISALLIALFLPCAFSAQVFATEACQVWFEPPLRYKEFFHANSTYAALGFTGILALVIYLFYLSYFVVFRLGRQGRSATNQ